VSLLVCAAGRPGELWELRQVVRCTRATRVLIVLPNSEDEYQEFLNDTAPIFPKPLPEVLPPSRLLTFQSNWDCRTLVAPTIESNSEDIFGDQLLATLRPFIRQNGFELLPSQLLKDKLIRWARVHFPDQG
jgi:hypothetical protein